MSTSPAAAQVDSLERGIAELYSREELQAKLERSATSGKALVVKLGLDPTAPDVHLGHAVVLRKARQFQDLGHKVIIIIGDFTARIGDPSGKSQTRPVLTDADVEANAQTYLQQVGHILDSDPTKLELRHNRDWLEKLSFEEVLRLAGKTTVARLLERDTFETRWKAQEPIGFHEMFYPLMQGYDSIAIESDIELGGTDQTYNNLFGRDLQRWVGQEPQCVLTMPILRGLDGVKKMSKSLDNYVGVTEDANSMVQKLFSMSDDLVAHYFELLTARDMGDVQEAIEAGSIVQLKKELAAEIAGAFHPAEDVQLALANIESDIPVDMQEIVLGEGELDDEGRIWVVKLLEVCGFPGSNRDRMSRVGQGALRIDRQVETDPKASIVPASEFTVTFGNVKKKTNWRRVRREP